MLGHDDFTVTPRRGELVVFDKLARSLVSHILLPVPTARGKGVLVSPTVYGNVMLGPTADDLDDKTATGTTADGLEALRRQGIRILPALLEEEVTTTYAGSPRGDRARRLPGAAPRRAAVRLRRRHPLDRAHRVARARRARRRADGGGRLDDLRPAPPVAPRPPMPNLGEAFPRPYAQADLGRRRPRVRPDRLPLRARDLGRDPRRARRSAPAGRRPKACDGGRGRAWAAAKASSAAPPSRLACVGSWRPRSRAAVVSRTDGRRRPRRRRPARPGWRSAEPWPRRRGVGGGPRPGARGRRHPAALAPHGLRAARPAPRHDRPGLRATAGRAGRGAGAVVRPGVSVTGWAGRLTARDDQPRRARAADRPRRRARHRGPRASTPGPAGCPATARRASSRPGSCSRPSTSTTCRSGRAPSSSAPSTSATPRW